MKQQKLKRPSASSATSPMDCFRRLLKTLLVIAVIGGAVGAILLSRINSRWITRIFSALVIWSGMRMLVG